MSITLGGITLHDDLRFYPEPESIPARVQETAATRGGYLIRWEKTLKDRPIDLIGGEDYGWLTLANIQSLKALADTDKWEGTLNYHGTSFTVYWRHTEPPVIEFTPKIDYTRNPAVTTDKVCNVKLKLVWKAA
jgi:hypothetical protein